MLSSDRNLNMLTGPVGPEWSLSVAAGYQVWRGSIVAVCADGTIVQAGTTGTPAAVEAIIGLAQHLQNNTGSTLLVGAFVGGGPVRCQRGTWNLPFDVPPTWANYGAPVYAIDDQTVSLTQVAGAVTRLKVGTFVGLTQDGTPYVTI